MTAQKIYTQNSYSTYLSSAITAATGDISFTVAVAPQYTRGWMFIGPESNPEEVYFHNVIGNEVFVSGANRVNPGVHEVTDPVFIQNSSAKLINTLFDLSQMTFYPEITGMLQISLFPGPYSIDGAQFDYAGENITIPNDATTYIYFRFLDNTIRQANTDVNFTDSENEEFGQLLHTVTSAGGRITAIGQNTTRVLLNKNTIVNGGTNINIPTLTVGYINTLNTGTLSSGAKLAFFNTGDTVDKKITIENFAAYLAAANLLPTGYVGYVHTQASASTTWTITHNLASTRGQIQFYDNSSPSNPIFPDSFDFYSNYVTVTFLTAIAGFAVFSTPAGTANAAQQPTAELVAGEDIGQAKAVRMGISGRESGMNNSYVPGSIPATFDTLYTGKTLYQTWKALKSNLTAAEFYIKKNSGADTTGITVEVFATTTQVISGHTYNVPTGAAIATGTIAAGAFSSTAAWVPVTFSVPYATTPGTYYAFKLTAVGAQTVHVCYGSDTVDYLTNGFSFISSLTPIVTDFLFKARVSALTSEVTSKVYLASAFEAATTEVVGTTLGSVLSGLTARVEVLIATTHSGLSEGIPYYLSDTPGEISQTPGTVTKRIGLPISTTSILLK